MTGQLTLLTLPPELRAQIYRAYLHQEDGYFHNFETGKLTAINNQPLDLALMSTCSLIAREMRGMPLSVNTVTFTTFYSDDIHTRARLWDAFLTELWLKEIDELMQPQFLDKSAYEQLHCKYPQFAPVLDYMKAQGRDDLSTGATDTWGESLSLCRSFITEMLQLMSKHPDFDHFMSARHWTANAHEIISLPRFPWVLPDMESLRTISRVLSYDLDRLQSRKPQRWKYRMSAASVAIRYLSSLAVDIRCQFRNVLLHDDQPSSAYPSTHAQGLIEFCRENPNLRIERRVNIWKAAWVGTLAGRVDCVGPVQSENLPSSTVTRFLGRWMADALALTAFGMPASSFILTFDGDIYSDRASEILQQAVHRDAAWHQAVEIAYAREIFPKPLLARTFHGYYGFTGFPKAMQDIVQGNSIIRFNFDPGVPYDVEELMDEHRDLQSGDSWDRAWPTGIDNQANFTAWKRGWLKRSELCSPSPTVKFLDLFRENIVYEEES